MAECVVDALQELSAYCGPDFVAALRARVADTLEPFGKPECFRDANL